MPTATAALSPRKLEANRQNALKSTGPRTPDGKARSSLNALKHGICSNTPVIPGECGGTYGTYHREICEDLVPTTPLQHALADRIVALLWRMRRVQDAETALYMAYADQAAARPDPPNLDSAVPVCSQPSPSPCSILAHAFLENPAANPFLLYSRYEMRLSSELRHLLKEFTRLQRRPIPKAPEPFYNSDPYEDPDPDPDLPVQMIYEPLEEGDQDPADQDPGAQDPSEAPVRNEPTEEQGAQALGARPQAPEDTSDDAPAPAPNEPTEAATPSEIPTSVSHPPDSNPPLTTGPMDPTTDKGRLTTDSSPILIAHHSPPLPR